MTNTSPTPDRTRFDPLSVLWRLAAAPQALLVLVGLIALTLVLGSLVPQIPPQAVDDPQAWLALQPGFLGQGSGLVRSLGLFDLYHGFWFRLLLVLTGLVLLVGLVESAESAWRTAGSLSNRRRQRLAAHNLALWRSRASHVRLPTSLSLDDVENRLGGFLDQRRFRHTQLLDLPVLNWLVARRAPLLWAQPVIYGALLLALIGLAVEDGWGWQSEDWRPAPGESLAVGHGSPFSVRLDAFDMQFGKDGRLNGYQSVVTWLPDAAVEAKEPGPRQAVADIGRPASLRGVSVRQVGYLPAVKLRAWDDSGRQLALQVGGDTAASTGDAEVSFSSAEAQPLVYVPSQDLFLLLAFEPLSGEGRPALRVDVVRNGGASQQTLDILYESGPVVAKGLRLKVDLAYHPVLRLDYRPAMAVVVAGLALALVALLVSWLGSPRLFLITAGSEQEGPAKLQVSVPADLTGGWWLPHLVRQLREALGDGD
jgi:hypothetical protein